MGNKRKREEEARIARKIKKLEKKLQRRRRIIASDDDESEHEVQVLPESLRNPPATLPRPPLTDQEEVDMNVHGLTTLEPSTNLDSVVEPGPSTAPDIVTTYITNQEEESELEEDILKILGEAPQADLTLGKNIRKDIASRWQDILQKGLSKEVKEQIIKNYVVPANCHLLVAPLLNPETKAAVSDIIARRDTTLLLKQNQIGVVLAALSELSEMILHNETSKHVLLQPLSDACRLLCDSHNAETKTRRSILMSSFNAGLRDILASTARDKYLFGEDLAEKLKAAKTVQKTGESLLKIDTVVSTNKNTNFRNNTRRNLNYRGLIQRKPPYKPNETSRGRAPTRQTRTLAHSQPPPPPPSKASSLTRRNYRR